VPGSDAPRNDIVVMDNCRVHLAPAIREAIEAFARTFIFVPEITEHARILRPGDDRHWLAERGVGLEFELRGTDI
jgi:hypothetical protein